MRTRQNSLNKAVQTPVWSCSRAFRPSCSDTFLTLNVCKNCHCLSVCHRTVAECSSYILQTVRRQPKHRIPTTTYQYQCDIVMWNPENILPDDTSQLLSKKFNFLPHINKHLFCRRKSSTTQLTTSISVNIRLVNKLFANMNIWKTN